ncbi:MAG: glycosyltransferase family 9 protein [Pseudomonadota bacterium]
MILQPLPGVGDMVWHLPAIHRLAALHPDREKVLLTKQRSRADELFAADPAIDRVIWVDRAEKHAGPGGFRALINDLRQEGFARSYQLHHSSRYAGAIAGAGIPERFAYGTTAVTRWLSQPPHLGTAMRRDHPIDLANQFIELLDAPPVDHADQLRVSPELANQVQQNFAGFPKPWIAIGVGSSEAFKQWGAERFASFVAALAAKQPATFFLLGGPGEAAFQLVIEAALTGSGASRLVAGFEWPISHIIAAQAAMDAYVGNDTAFLNISAAVGVQAFGLFGATEPLRYSPLIEAIMPEDGPISCEDGMARIHPAKLADQLSERLFNHR